MQVNPYLSFNGQCEEAFRLYERCFAGQLGAIFRYAGSPMADQVAADWQDKVMHGSVTIGGSVVGGVTSDSASIASGLDVGPVKIGHDVLGGIGIRAGAVTGGRNLGNVTIGGSLVNGDSAADLPAVLLALEGSVVVRGAGGEREIAAADLFEGYLSTAVKPAYLWVSESTVIM